jgi:hypothetical protein
MSLDEMAIHKGLRYDPGTKTILGYITSLFADQTQAQKEPEIASKVMVIMLKFIKSGEEKIVGYFFTNGNLKGVEIAALVKGTMRRCKEAGIVVNGVVCDGPATNIAMLNEMGNS